MDSDTKDTIEFSRELAQHFYDYWKLTPPDRDSLIGKVFREFRKQLTGTKTIKVKANWVSTHEVEVPADWDEDISNEYDDSVEAHLIREFSSSNAHLDEWYTA